VVEGLVPDFENDDERDVGFVLLRLCAELAIIESSRTGAAEVRLADIAEEVLALIHRTPGLLRTLESSGVADSNASDLGIQDLQATIWDFGENRSSRFVQRVGVDYCLVPTGTLSAMAPF
jgi:hypothetical protein